MKSNKLRKIIVENGEIKKFPAWIRTAFIDDASGEIFMPAAAISKNETSIMMCACFDGAHVVTSKRHVYVPISWAEREYPGVGLICDRIRDAMKNRGMTT
jgi:hypothetical protein